MSPQVTMYSTVWCGHCRRLQRTLREAGIDFTVVDIDKRPELGRRIEQKTGGFRTVPTLEIGGDLLVNPRLEEVQRALQTT